MSIPIQDMYPKDLRKHAEKNKYISTLIFTTALFTLANKQKESKCPWTISWKMGTFPKKEANFSASMVADVTMSFRSERRATT